MGNTMFSTRHYTAIEEIMRDLGADRDDLTGAGLWTGVKGALADLFEADNPKFKREKFYAE